MKLCRSTLFEAGRDLFMKNWKIYSRKTSMFLQLKPYLNSFRRIWRTYGQQVSRKTVAKSLAACDTRRLHEENQLRFSNSKHFRFYWTKNNFISEWYFTKNHEIGSLVVRKVKKSWDSRQNRELGPALESKTFRHVYGLDESKRFKNFCLKVGHSNLKHSKSTIIALWLLRNVQNQHIADRERSTTVVVLIAGAFVGSPLIYESCLHLSDTFACRSAHNNLFLTLRVIHNLKTIRNNSYYLRVKKQHDQSPSPTCKLYCESFFQNGGSRHRTDRMGCFRRF